MGTPTTSRARHLRYVTLKTGVEASDPAPELNQWRGDRPHAAPDLIQWAPGSAQDPLARSCAHLRKIAENDHSNLGDISTLADPAVVQDLIDNRMNRG